MLFAQKIDIHIKLMPIYLVLSEPFTYVSKNRQLPARYFPHNTKLCNLESTGHIMKYEQTFIMSQLKTALQSPDFKYDIPLHIFTQHPASPFMSRTSCNHFVKFNDLALSGNLDAYGVNKSLLQHLKINVLLARRASN